jgi:MYXO-CTERM domain-containing protein
MPHCETFELRLLSTIDRPRGQPGNIIAAVKLVQGIAMRKPLLIPLALIASMAVAGAAFAGPAPFTVRWESEVPGSQFTTATFTAGGAVETFNEQLAEPGVRQSFTGNFGSGYSGNYRGVQILPADQYGGSGGVGNYAVALNSGSTYTLDFSHSTDPVTYFGYWLSALDAGNRISFFGPQNKLLFTFTPQDVINSINEQPNSSDYYGNPNGNFLGQDSGEPFVFVDFFADPGVTFTRVVFNEVNFGGGYESDNHTVGEWLTQGTGTLVAITPAPAPEPATWALALVGFGLIGAALRRRPPVSQQST